jgi:hypothetical protein
MSEAVAAEAIETAEAEAAPSASEILGNIFGAPVENETESEGETAPEEATEEQPEAEASKEQPSKPTKGKDFFRKELFSDEALKTPGGIMIARKALQERERYNANVHLRVTERDQKSKVRESNAKQWEDRAVTLHRNIHSLQSRLTNGDAAQALEALGQLMGTTGLDAYERLTDTLVRNGKAKPGSELAEVRKTVEELRGELKTRDTKAQQEREQATIRQALHTFAMRAQTDEFPSIAYFARQGTDQLTNAVQWIDKTLRDHYQETGQPLDPSAAFATLEELLRPHAAEARAQTGEQPGAGRATSTKPKPANGRTISPARAATSSVARSTDDMTDTERREVLARDTDYLRRMGLPV